MTGRGKTMVRRLARNVQVYNLPNSGGVGWTPPLAGAAALRVCAPLAGTRPPAPVRERARPGEGRPRTALHLACTTGQSAVVALLTEWHCDLNPRDKEGKTALIKAVQCQKEVCVTVLLEHGADPNLEDNCQNTALHYAILAGDMSVATKLLHYNANIKATDKVNLRRGIGRVADSGCSEESGLPQRARVFAQISPLSGSRAGLCYSSCLAWGRPPLPQVCWTQAFENSTSHSLSHAGTVGPEKDILETAHSEGLAELEEEPRDKVKAQPLASKPLKK
ncbi:death-associated protein kinase dapk-1-like [Camelus ferus]|uniref:Death-associated protein kinase dapk-1-like n=1 Tax=Camelus ferus TaxID=419612 RepID=A0A8B8SIM5_CAMFR|nr:death-associated protein kinase dapk-1-like [Camelus ferus]